MFRKSKAQEIDEFFTLPLAKRELAVFYLGTSAFLARSMNQTVVIDPAGLLKKDEAGALESVNLVLFTHNHFDHFRPGTSEAIFKATGAPVLAEAKVANKLKGKIAAEKLVSRIRKNIYFRRLNCNSNSGNSPRPNNALPDEDE